MDQTAMKDFYKEIGVKLMDYLMPIYITGGVTDGHIEGRFTEKIQGYDVTLSFHPENQYNEITGPNLSLDSKIVRDRNQVKQRFAIEVFKITDPRLMISMQSEEYSRDDGIWHVLETTKDIDGISYYLKKYGKESYNDLERLVRTGKPMGKETPQAYLHLLKEAAERQIEFYWNGHL